MTIDAIESDTIRQLNARALCRSGPFLLDVENGQPVVWKRVIIRHTEPHEPDRWDVYRVGSLHSLKHYHQGKRAREAERAFAEAMRGGGP